MNGFNPGDKVTVTIRRRSYTATVREVLGADFYSVEDAFGARWSVRADALKPAGGGNGGAQ